MTADATLRLRLVENELRFDDETAMAATAIDGGWILPAGPVSVTHDLGSCAFYRHGWNSWSPTGWAPLTDSPMRIYGDAPRLLTADDAATDRPDLHEGSGLGALELPDGQVLLLGALGLGTPRVGASPDELWATLESQGSEWFLGLGDEADVFARYAELLRERLGTPPAERVDTLWCSWYSFFEDIDETLVNKTIDDLGDLPFDVVQLDDGWERIVGDWTANERFPSGMAALAERITARGSRPGLWLAPFICLPDSAIVRDHPDWLVHAASGEPLVAGYNWDSHYYALDTTHPAAAEHLDRVFAELVGFGFRYLKLDFLYAGGLPGVRHLDLPREQVYRDALLRIRRVVGDDVYLLGCGAPLLPSVGVLDGVRVGPDTASDWVRPGTVEDPSHEGGLNGLTASVERLWMSDLFQVDPDVAFFRSAHTTLTPEQREALQLIARVSGFRSTSDPIDWLSADEADSLRVFLERSEEVRRIGRYRYEVGDEVVDFTPFVREVRTGREHLRETNLVAPGASE
ncbi:glycoside hydrolase family 36 protein [Frondihabitans sp. Leaf304]|uniref:glycoside hydrolase family 36 protein n=1 Tax=Frondihabitans sp. Leaf304 TaxID=1736329 RepID=UPI000A033BFF|nr:glycoside hydrolase family 36 protein [Frondihabitans sp. Leaf304]